MEKILIFGLLLVIVGLLILLFRREHTITELRGLVDSTGTELREERARRVISERAMSAVKYRLGECSTAISSIISRNGTVKEIVTELKRRYTEMENMLFSSADNNGTGINNNNDSGAE